MRCGLEIHFNAFQTLYFYSKCVDVFFTFAFSMDQWVYPKSEDSDEQHCTSDGDNAKAVL